MTPLHKRTFAKPFRGEEKHKQEATELQRVFEINEKRTFKRGIETVEVRRHGTNSRTIEWKDDDSWDGRE